MRLCNGLLWGALILSAFCGCQEPTEDLATMPDYNRQLPPGELALRKITDPNQIPDFSAAIRFTTGLDTAIARSLNYLGKPSSRNYFPYGRITHQDAIDSLQVLREVLTAAGTGEEFDAMIRDRFDVYQSVGYDDEGTVLFTGYYRPIFDASLEKTDEHRFPLYKMPDDLVKDEQGNTVGRRLSDGTVLAGYPTRREIEMGGMLRGKELVWLKDPFEAYVVNVQGSAILRLPDETYFEIGYAANNGHSYVSIGQKLIDDGKIPAEQLSLRAMMEFFEQFPQETEYYIRQNPRYIFFRPAKGGPFGSLNERVTPYRSIATDKNIYPRACAAFVVTQLPSQEEGRIVQRHYRAFALDQDTGGAIRAAGRCDIFLGTGEEVGELAGRTFKEGQLYYLFLKQ